MRVRITFRVKNRGTSIPFHHQFLIAQVLKGLMLTSGDDRFSSFDNYSFSGLKGQTKVSRNGLHYTSNRVTLVLTSPEKDFIDFLIKQIFQQTHLEISQLIIVPEQVEQELPVDARSEMKYICISPLVILQPSFNSDAGKQFIEPGTDDFSDLIYDSTIERMQSAGIRVDNISDLEKFQVVPDLSYINKIRQSNKKFARIYPLYDQDVKYEIRGYTFPFTLYAPPEIQKFVLQSGLGLFCNKGFGMLDIANEDPTKRTVNYEIERLISA